MKQEPPTHRAVTWNMETIKYRKKRSARPLAWRNSIPLVVYLQGFSKQ